MAFQEPEETGLGRLSGVIRELFGRDTIRAALLERALLDWIRVESRRQSEQQMTWYRQFHPGTRDHTAYCEDSEEEEGAQAITQEINSTRMRTAAGGGGDPNDPDDDPRRRGSRRSTGR